MRVYFREAKDSDHGGIVELSRGIYGDADTLVYSFLDWLKSDRWFQFVAEDDQQKIVAFIAANMTDGMDSMNLRCARVHKDYRGHGLYKALVNYAVRYVREKVRDVKFAYRVQVVEVSVPDGYNIVKRIGLIVMSFGDDAKAYIAKNSLVQANIVFMTWPEFKVMYNRSGEVKELFGNSTLEIGCDVFNLNCKANWSLLEERVDTRILVTEYEDVDGKKEIMVSFLRLEKFLTNEGVPMTAMNVYGLDKRALKCHIAKGILEAGKYVGGSRFFMELYSRSEVMVDCRNILMEICGRNVDYEGVSYLLQCNLRSGVKDRGHLCGVPIDSIAIFDR